MPQNLEALIQNKTESLAPGTAKTFVPCGCHRKGGREGRDLHSLGLATEVSVSCYGLDESSRSVKPFKVLYLAIAATAAGGAAGNRIEATVSEICFWSRVSSVRIF